MSPHRNSDIVSFHGENKWTRWQRCFFPVNGTLNQGAGRGPPGVSDEVHGLVFTDRHVQGQGRCRAAGDGNKIPRGTLFPAGRWGKSFRVSTTNLTRKNWKMTEKRLKNDWKIRKLENFLSGKWRIMKKLEENLVFWQGLTRKKEKNFEQAKEKVPWIVDKFQNDGDFWRCFRHSLPTLRLCSSYFLTHTRRHCSTMAPDSFISKKIPSEKDFFHAYSQNGLFITKS